MKHFSIFSFLAAFLLCFSCTTEQVEPNLTKPDPTPEHHVAVETALADLNALLIDLDGGGTRSGGTRTVANVATVRTSELGMATRSADPSVEELVYIANFENNAGYAILGADDRLESVIAITEQGNLTSTQFAAAARGEYDHVAEPPVLPEVATYALGLGGNIGGGGIGGGGIGGDPGSGNIP
ncbi:MAG: Spi family protease inhibitor, partial [Alistipes sp.]